VTKFVKRLQPGQEVRCPGFLKVKLVGRPPDLMMAALCLYLASQPAATGEPWQAPLAGGGQVQVDPRTHQPIFSRDGRQTQLWDGVHRLEDGSVILVQEGRVVPRQDMLNPPVATEQTDGTVTPPTAITTIKPVNSLQAGPLAGTPPCEQLVEKVCGQVIECWGKPACAAARQLRAMDHEELLAGGDPAQGTQTGKQCIEAMKNDYFSPCPLSPPPP
jgi:hypothetical protein